MRRRVVAVLGAPLARCCFVSNLVRRAEVQVRHAARVHRRVSSACEEAAFGCLMRPRPAQLVQIRLALQRTLRNAACRVTESSCSTMRAVSSWLVFDPLPLRSPADTTAVAILRAPVPLVKNFSATQADRCTILGTSLSRNGRLVKS